MNYLTDFKNFYLRTVLPNIPSYESYFNTNNFDSQIARLIDNYKKSFGYNPFEVSDVEKSIDLFKTNIVESDNDFSKYNNHIGSGVPRAILTSHFSTFLKFYAKQIEFPNFQNLIDQVHEGVNKVGRNENFIKKFREYRRDIIGQSKIVNQDLLFGAVRENYWTINVGAEKELQYHIHLNDSGYVKYGIGFNIQASANNYNPIENVRPFKNAFYSCKPELNRILQDYKFWHDEEENLKKLNYDTFILYGQEIPFIEDADNYKIQGLDYLKMLYDLKYKQFKSYKLIFESSKKTPTQLLNSILMNTHKELLEYKKQIILQGPPGTGKTRQAKEIAKKIIGVDTIDELESHEQFKLVQFHPSYTYEDFVEGLKPVIKGDKLTYEVQPGVLKSVVKEAMKAYLSNGISEREDNSFDQLFLEFAQSLKAKNDNNPTVFTTKSNIEIYFHGFSDSHIDVIYKWANRDKINEGTHIFKLSKLKFQQLVENKIDPSKVKNLRHEIKPTVKFHQSEYFAVYKELYKFIVDKQVDVDAISITDDDYNSIFEVYQQLSDSVKNSEAKKYILVIDEINRANLSSVMGELIYGLEYRGKEVQSIYGEEGEAPLVIPPNLYIIGTMNTADRSVGHIDYAIRRRFAFVDVLPKDLSNDDTIIFHKGLFEKVSRLFIKNYDEYLVNEKTPLKATATLSSEFRPEDVWLGHSYFIQKKEKDESGNEIFIPNEFSIRLEYEIKPILLEYVKDGILVGENIKDEIFKLEV